MTSGFQVTQKFIADPCAAAEMVEQLFDFCLEPYLPGFYLPFQSKPAMLPGKWYYKDVQQPDGHISNVTINTLDDITTAIKNQDGEIVIPFTQASRVTVRPNYPVRGIQIALLLIGNTLDRLSPWKTNAKMSAAEVVYGVLSDAYKASQTEEQAYEVAQRIADYFIDMREEVVRFVGDDAWIMHFVRLWGATTIVVEKTIDYRIYDWERKMHAGEWKQSETSSDNAALSANEQSIKDIEKFGVRYL